MNTDLNTVNLRDLDAEQLLRLGREVSDLAENAEMPVSAERAAELYGDAAALHAERGSDASDLLESATRDLLALTLTRQAYPVSPELYERARVTGRLG